MARSPESSDTLALRHSEARWPSLPQLKHFIFDFCLAFGFGADAADAGCGDFMCQGWVERHIPNVSCGMGASHN